eukprot:scaffold28081_cov69-Phaeocystis_antarctica.AAC.2
MNSPAPQPARSRGPHAAPPRRTQARVAPQGAATRRPAALDSTRAAAALPLTACHHPRLLPELGVQQAFEWLRGAAAPPRADEAAGACASAGAAALRPAWRSLDRVRRSPRWLVLVMMSYEYGSPLR